MEQKIDPQISAEVKRLAEKDPTALTEPEKQFMRARKSYFGRNSRQKFAEVFNEVPTDPEKTKDSTQPGTQTKEEKKKRGRPTFTANPKQSPTPPSTDEGEDETGNANTLGEDEE